MFSRYALLTAQSRSAPWSASAAESARSPSTGETSGTIDVISPTMAFTPRNAGASATVRRTGSGDVGAT